MVTICVKWAMPLRKQVCAKMDYRFPIFNFQLAIDNHKLVVSLSNPSKISVTVNFSVLLCALVGLNCPQYIPL